MMARDELIFRDEAAALDYVTTIRWPRGPFCPYCMQTEGLDPDPDAGLVPRYACPCCKNSFTATTATLFGRDSIPLTKWLKTLEILSPARRRSLPAMLQTALSPGDINPELCLVANGRAVRASTVDHFSFRFDLPPHVSDLVLRSRHVVPGQHTPNNPDLRRLGVSLREIELEAGEMTRRWNHDDPALIDGFYPAEATHRWTSGYALLPADVYADIATPFVVRVKLANLSLRYPPGQGL
jgi:hypothetical protein